MPGFSLDEIRLLKRVIDNNPALGILKDAVVRKLYMHSEQDVLAQDLVEIKVTNCCEQLASAIKEKRTVQLVNYHSANSNSITTREVEPITFSDDCKMMLVFDISSKENRHFKVERMESVLELQ